jgi:RNA polymerase sigma factor (sigma-70 family)
MRPESDDVHLWARVRADDEIAFAAVFDRYHARVQHTVARQLADVPRADVPAVAAEVFHTAWQRRSSVEIETSVWPWLRGVATRLCANERRRCLRQDLLAARTSSAPAALVEPDHSAFVATQIAFTAALSRLGAVEAEVAELAIVQDLSEAEVARRLRVPVGTVKSRLHRARRELRRHLGGALTLRPPAPSTATGWSDTPGGLAPAHDDVAYASASPSQRLDLWTPGADGATPLVVFIHGGGWEQGSRTAVATKLRPLLDAGFAVAAVDYRLSGEQPFPAAVEDVAAAVRHLASLDVVDADRVALWGESAGANIACVLGALSGRTAPWSPAGDVLPTVAAVVDWFGPTDLTRMDDQAAQIGCAPAGHGGDDSPESRYLGSPLRTSPDLAALAGPLTHVASADPVNIPAFAIAHGTADCVVAPGQSALLVEALQDRGCTPWTTWLDGADHGGVRFDAELMIPTVDWLQQVLETR